MTESIWLRSMGRLRDLLLSLFEQCKGFIDSVSETNYCDWTATQVRRDHHVDFDTLAFRQNRVCRQFDLNSAIVDPECRNAIKVNERCELRGSRAVRSVAPNVIHGCDASHAIFTINACAAEDIELATNHDCFSMLAPDAKRFNEIVREQFVRLHERDLLGEIRNSAEKAGATNLPPVPRRGKASPQRRFKSQSLRFLTTQPTTTNRRCSSGHRASMSFEMRKKDDAIQIEFVCPKSLAEELDRLAADQFCSRSAVLRRLVAEAAGRMPGRASA